MGNLFSTVDVTTSTDPSPKSGGSCEGSSDVAWIMEVKTWLAFKLAEGKVLEFEYNLHHVAYLHALASLSQA